MTSPILLEAPLSRLFFHEPDALEKQVETLLAAGNTVYISSRGVQKIKRGDDLIRFSEITRFDQNAGRNIANGGFYSTSDPDEIAFIDSFRDLQLRKFSPPAPKPVVEDKAKK